MLFALGLLQITLNQRQIAFTDLMLTVLIQINLLLKLGFFSLLLQSLPEILLRLFLYRVSHRGVIVNTVYQRRH